MPRQRQQITSDGSADTQSLNWLAGKVRYLEGRLSELSLQFDTLKPQVDHLSQLTSLITQTAAMLDKVRDSAADAYQRTWEIETKLNLQDAAQSKMQDELELLSKVFVFVDVEQVAKNVASQQSFKSCCPGDASISAADVTPTILDSCASPLPTQSSTSPKIAAIPAACRPSVLSASLVEQPATTVVPALDCQRCGELHRTEECPHFSRPRDSHRDAWHAFQPHSSE